MPRYRVQYRNVHSGDADAETWIDGEWAPTKADAEVLARQWVDRGYESRIEEESEG